MAVSALSCHDLGQELGQDVPVIVGFVSGIDNDSLSVSVDGNRLIAARFFSGQSLGLIGVTTRLPIGPHVLRLELPGEQVQTDFRFAVTRASWMRINISYSRIEKAFAFETLVYAPVPSP